jgi:hypothetical protein
MVRWAEWGKVSFGVADEDLRICVGKGVQRRSGEKGLQEAAIEKKTWGLFEPE